MEQEEAELAGAEGDVRSLDFTNDISVDDTDGSGDGRGFDDNPNDTLYFNNW